jgi:hypothetical protein
MRNTLIICVILMVSSGFKPETIKSDLYIPAHEQFVLGGGQDFKFNVSAKNVGLAKVHLFLSLNGFETDLGYLEQGETLDASVPEKASVLVRNETALRAHLKVKAKGKSDNLGMSYEKVE